jgi:Cys-rich protein (TIGR01571 family)
MGLSFFKEMIRFVLVTAGVFLVMHLASCGVMMAMCPEARDMMHHGHDRHLSHDHGDRDHDHVDGQHHFWKSVFGDGGEHHDHDGAHVDGEHHFWKSVFGDGGPEDPDAPHGIPKECIVRVVRTHSTERRCREDGKRCAEDAQTTQSGEAWPLATPCTLPCSERTQHLSRSLSLSHTQNMHTQAPAVIAIAALGLTLFVYVTLFFARRRTALRETFGIDGTPKEDCLLYAFCAPCALAQETRTLMHEQVHGGVWYGALPGVVAAPVAAPVPQKMAV